jgi:hypothetical protein
MTYINPSKRLDTTMALRTARPHVRCHARIVSHEIADLLACGTFCPIPIPNLYLPLRPITEPSHSTACPRARFPIERTVSSRPREAGILRHAGFTQTKSFDCNLCGHAGTLLIPSTGVGDGIIDGVVNRKEGSGRGPHARRPGRRKNLPLGWVGRGEGGVDLDLGGIWLEVL